MERTIKANKFLNDENIWTKISTERMKMAKNMSNDIIIRVHLHDSNHMYHCINLLLFLNTNLWVENGNSKLTDCKSIGVNFVIPIDRPNGMLMEYSKQS